MAREVVSEFEARRVQRMLHDLFARWLRPGEGLAVTASEEAGWVSMRWELATPARDRVYLVDARVDARKARLREREAVELLYDFFGAQFEAYVRDREPFSGPDWEEVAFEGRTLHLRGQETGEGAEASADTILLADALIRSRELAAAAQRQAVEGAPGDAADDAQADPCDSGKPNASAGMQTGDDRPDPDA
ncbi:MAG: hypothetical protein EXR79_14100 [Myxococcales bacterium]|nr:hypothetical protein [Myxococcales bacterium]